MKREEAFPHLAKTYDFDPEDSPAHNAVQHYYDRMLESIGHDATPEQVILFMDRIDTFMQAVRQLQSDMKQSVIEWIEEHGDLIVDEDTRYYVGKARTTKCRDLNKVGMELRNYCGGDLKEILSYMKAEGWKHGAVKKALGEKLFNELYWVEEKPDLKSGKPLKLLKKSNPLLKPQLERKPK